MPDEMEAWKNVMQQDIINLKSNQSNAKNERDKMRDDISDLKLNDRLQDQEINAIKDTLKDIKADTNWIRRKITGAVISAIATLVIVTIGWYVIQDLLN
jgi:chromosome segregation ATPase